MRHASEHEAADDVVHASTRDLVGQNLSDHPGRSRNRMAGFDELVEGRRQLGIHRLRSMLAPELDEVLIEGRPCLPADVECLTIGSANDDVALDSDERRRRTLMVGPGGLLAVSILDPAHPGTLPARDPTHSIARPPYH